MAIKATDGVYVPTWSDRYRAVQYSAVRVQLVSAYCFPATVHGLNDFSPTSKVVLAA